MRGVCCLACWGPISHWKGKYKRRRRCRDSMSLLLFVCQHFTPVWKFISYYIVKELTHTFHFTICDLTRQDSNDKRRFQSMRIIIIPSLLMRTISPTAGVEIVWSRVRCRLGSITYLCYFHGSLVSTPWTSL